MWSSPRRILRRDRAGEGMATRARRVGRLVGQHDLGRRARRHGDRDVEASPHWSAARVIPIWPRNQPSASSTPSAFRPVRRAAVTS